jgi:hypothetical protein
VILVAVRFKNGRRFINYGKKAGQNHQAAVEETNEEKLPNYNLKRNKSMN